MMSGRLEIIALEGLPLVQAGDDLVRLIAAALERQRLVLAPHDVLVVAQKIVSKAEGRLVRLADVRPGTQALALAQETGKDARVCELILGQSRRIVRTRPNLVIAEHRLGYIMANAGIDQSNIEGSESALLLPVDPDASAERLRVGMLGGGPGPLGVIVNDSFGRPWRVGTVGVALGVAGLPAICDLRGTPDLFGRPLKVTVTGFADEIAAAASLVMGQAAESRPVVLVRGLSWSGAASDGQALVRTAAEDLFR